MESQKVSFSSEIALMMFGFGDSHMPNLKTVSLVESITLKQLQTIVQEALKYSKDNKELKGQELVFLLRHNKAKMQRFIHYLKNIELKSSIQSMNSNKVMEIDVDPKPKHELMAFIEYIDETGELTDLTEFDEVKYERQLRADRISQALDEKKYLEFCKARGASFRSKNFNKLRMWIDPKMEVNFSNHALDVLAYFAYQTVAEIMDSAFLVRTDTKCGTDPLAHSSGSYYTATMFSGDHRFEDSSSERVNYNGQAPISVTEIKEVMRRLHSPQAGKLNFGGKVPETHYLFAL